ncbi:MAG: hypothetical protein FD126_2896, partial [Elusimicrobia bacterium]
MKRYALAAALLSLSVACKKDEIQVYKVAKPAEGAAAVAKGDGHDHKADG